MALTTIKAHGIEDNVDLNLGHGDDLALATDASGISVHANNSSIPGLSGRVDIGDSGNCRIEIYDNNAANSATNNNTFKIYSQHGADNTTKTSILNEGFFDQVWRTAGSASGPATELGRVNYDGGWEFNYHNIQGNQGNSWSGTTTTKRLEVTNTGVAVTGAGTFTGEVGIGPNFTNAATNASGIWLSDTGRTTFYHSSSESGNYLTCTQSDGSGGSSTKASISGTGAATFAGVIQSLGNAQSGAASGSCLVGEGGLEASSGTATQNLVRTYTTGNSTPTCTIKANGAGTFSGGVLTGAYDPADSATSGLNLQDSGRAIARRQTGTDVLWLGLHGSTTGSEITAAGNATFAGAVKIGGTAAANEMDEYEEGSWTPTQGAGITLVGSFSSAGDYIKIGNLVHVTGWIQGGTSIAISAGAAVILGGLPFNIKAGGDDMRYDFIVGSGGVTGGGYAWNTSFYTYSMTTNVSATSQKIYFQMTYSILA